LLQGAEDVLALGFFEVEIEEVGGR